MKFDQVLNSIIDEMLHDTFVEYDKSAKENLDPEQRALHFEKRLSKQEVPTFELVESENNYDHHIQLLKFVHKHGVQVLEAEFIEKLGVLRIFFKNQVVDFPMDWGPFKNWSKNSCFWNTATGTNDEYNLLDVIKTLTDLPIERIIFFASDTGMIMLPFNSHQLEFYSLVERFLSCDAKILEEWENDNNHLNLAA